MMHTLVERAVERGELGPAAVPERRLEVGHNLVRHEFLLNGDVAPEFLASIIDEVVLPLLRASPDRGR